MRKVALDTWGGTKVRNLMKAVWPLAGHDALGADAEFRTYQQSLATTIANTNELIDHATATDARLGVLESRPF